jgi:hypothetical protein
MNRDICFCDDADDCKLKKELLRIASVEFIELINNGDTKYGLPFHILVWKMRG